MQTDTRNWERLKEWNWNHEIKSLFFPHIVKAIWQPAKKKNLPEGRPAPPGLRPPGPAHYACVAPPPDLSGKAQKVFTPTNKTEVSLKLKKHPPHPYHTHTQCLETQ
ncbi:rCG38745 [Rattus norvegicus]|uniref:RCG38745 n=1 Tax=Rattus norvegicus TaxID=10116 RepID=A6K9I6_RAT|nr:rCG38745 [Rattus norvegicus]